MKGEALYNYDQILAFFAKISLVPGFVEVSHKLNLVAVEGDSK